MPPIALIKALIKALVKIPLLLYSGWGIQIPFPKGNCLEHPTHPISANRQLHKTRQNTPALLATSSQFQRVFTLSVPPHILKNAPLTQP